MALGSSSFTEDGEYALMSTLLGKRVELFFQALAPPTITVSGVFLPHPQDLYDEFPHHFSFGASNAEVRAKALPHNFSMYVVKGCLFVFAREQLPELVDRTMVNYKDLEVPKFVLDVIEEYNIPKSLRTPTEFFITVVDMVVHSPPENSKIN
ncbi:unnamed protein product [Arabis nemorensis]|uniref:Uncharacterized protein n=1 Tax=Arabis nemorensis TaxID=586526 RepID=A0A565CRR1_9BRAS|nr:unnamed protein product [Arabis nemorensis]